MDYASDVAGWTVERLGEVCAAYVKKPLDVAFSEAFPDVDLESLSINGTERIIVVGFAIESSLERMIEGLSDTYAVNVNAVVLSYARTRSGDHRSRLFQSRSSGASKSLAIRTTAPRSG